MKKLTLALLLIMLISCSGGSLINGIWEGEYGIIEFNEKKGIYRGMLFSGHSFNQDLTITGEGEFISDGKTFPANVSGNSLTIVGPTNGLEYVYEKYQRKVYSRRQVDKILEGAWESAIFSMTFNTKEKKVVATLSGGSVTEKPYEIGEIIGDWVLLSISEGDPTVLTIRDDKTIWFKVDDSESIAFEKR